MVKIIKYFCPKCGLKSNQCIIILEKSCFPENEKIMCYVCRWWGKWEYMSKVIEEG